MRVHARERVVPAHVARAQQVPRVAVERRVRGGIAHERDYGLARRLQRPGRAPCVLQDVQADLARLRACAGNP